MVNCVERKNIYSECGVGFRIVVKRKSESEKWVVGMRALLLFAFVEHLEDFLAVEIRVCR